MNDDDTPDGGVTTDRRRGERRVNDDDTPGNARLRESSGRLVPIGRLTFPLQSVVGLAVGVTALVMGAAAIMAHAADKTVHLDAEKSRDGGGPAYNRNVEAAIRKTTAEMRNTMRETKIFCAKDGDGFRCQMILPLEIPER